MNLFKSTKSYAMIDKDDPSVRLCFKRGFMPIGDTRYIDEIMTEISGLEKLIIIPEIETISINLIDDIVRRFDEYFDENGDLPGTMLQNMASWMFAWGLEMAWCWKNHSLEKIVFEQDMKSFTAPMTGFSLMPQDWFVEIVEAFLKWCYSNPEYTDRYEIDIYDPIRDGYLTIIRLAVSKTLPNL